MNKHRLSARRPIVGTGQRLSTCPQTRADRAGPNNAQRPLTRSGGMGQQEQKILKVLKTNAVASYCTDGYYLDEFGLQQPLPNPACYAEVDNTGPMSLTVGSQRKLALADASAIEVALSCVKWPRQARRSVNGFGTCLGLTNGKEGAYVGAYTYQCSSLVRLINSAISKLVDGTFRWTSRETARRRPGTA